MLRQIVRDYSVITPLASSDLVPRGYSLAPTWLLPNILDDNSAEVSVLDIGFGAGGLGQLIKSDPQLRHWSVDGVDGFGVNCNNPGLFEKKIYRNIWHGLAQEIPFKILAEYKIICLLDVIEHLTQDDAKLLLETLLGDMGQESLLFISTPLWFCPQDSQQTGDLEEHLIGVPVTSMTALKPTMYSINEPLIGGFVLNKKSLDFIDAFQPTTDRDFSLERGMALARSIGFQYDTGAIFKMTP